MQIATLSKESSLALPADSYIYKVVSVNGKLAAISSDDSLRIIDPNTLTEVHNGIVDNVHSGVTCLEAFKNDLETIVTAGRDATIRCWDLRSGKSTLEFRHGKTLQSEATNYEMEIG